jgi:membrane associated rhomboid family serine protease
MTAPDQASPAGHETPPTCYRHPDRETWVSCVRCGKPACPDCLREAAVGQQCVDCVREAGQGTRQARTAFGGRLVSGAMVTWALVAINVVLFLIELAAPSLQNSWGLLGYASPTGQPPLQGVAAGQWYRLVSAAFLSPGTSGIGFMDIIFNMWALIYVGPALEKMLGRSRYLTLYLLSAIGGSVLYYWMAAINAPAAGASGAIFGLFGAWFVVSKKLRLDTRGIIILIAINLAFSLIYRSTIAWQDHIGGLVTGLIVTAAFVYAPRKNRTAIQVGAAVVVLALLVLATALRSHQILAGF